jgi:hypothetical protein
MTKNYFIYETRNPVLLVRYQQAIRSNLDAICEARRLLVEEQKRLEAKTRLRPAECDMISSSLRTLLEAVRNFEEFLKAGDNLPQNAIPKRYKVFVSLNYTERHIQQIFPLLTSFRKICMQSSQESYKMLDELRRKVKILVRVSEALEPETKEMLTRVFSENFIILPVGTRNVDYKN